MKYKDLLIQLKADIIANVAFVKKYHCYVMPSPETWAMIKGYLHPIVLLVYNGSPVTTEGRQYINYSHLISFHVFVRIGRAFSNHSGLKRTEIQE